jgi:enterochelin esterase family protein
LILALAFCSLCAAQAGPQPRATAEENDTYCFGCPPDALTGTHPRSASELIQLANNHSPLLRQAIEETYPAKALELGRVWSGHLHDFFFAIRASAQPTLILDDQPGPPMQSLEGTGLWYAIAHIQQLGALHDFHYQIDGKNSGGSSWNMAAYTELSYPIEGTAKGQLSQKQTLASKIYDGVNNDYWIYVPAKYDPKTPTALMIFLDGGNLLAQQGGSRVLDVIDNLIYLRKIPMMLVVFLDPGKIDQDEKGPFVARVREFSDSRHWPPDQAMRSIQEDAVTDVYPRFLRDELVPAIAAHFNLRKDGYSHAIVGLSSGGQASFNAAWQMPDDFSRVLCGISSFASIQWKTPFAGTEGGQDVPDNVLEEQHRNIRVWLEDGSGDLESDQFGSWPLNNVRLANALKLKSYDFHFSFGKGGHGPEQIEAQFPEEMLWLWRDYDPSKTQQLFEIEGTEKAKPLFRVAIANRDAE